MEYELHIYGEGTYQAQCEEAAKKHQNIQYFGFCPQKDIFSDLLGSAALILPSNWYEGYPMILAESFSVAKPIVCTNLGNQCDIVTSAGGGVTFEYGDYDSFAAAIEDVIANNARYSENAYQYYLENQTKESNYRKLCDIYERAKHIQ